MLESAVLVCGYLQVLLLRDAAERDAAAVLPPELATAEFRAKMGLPDGAELTAEQVSVVDTFTADFSLFL